MTGLWVRIENDMFDDPKIEQVSHAGLVFWLAAIAYCNRRLSDGFVQADERVMARLRLDAKIEDEKPVIAELVRLGMFEKVGRGWTIVNYSKYQKTREQLDAERDARDRERASGRVRQRRYYERHLRSGPDGPEGGEPHAGANDDANGVTNASGEVNGRASAPVDIEDLRARRIG